LFSTFRFNHNNQFTDKNFRSFGGGEFTPFGEKDISNLENSEDILMFQDILIAGFGTKVILEKNYNLM
jgi:hypothetical protein